MTTQETSENISEKDGQKHEVEELETFLGFLCVPAGYSHVDGFALIVNVLY